MSDEEKSASDEEEPTQTLASSRTRRDNAGKRFFMNNMFELDFIPC